MSTPKREEHGAFPGAPPTRDEFYRGYTVEELARAQGVQPVERFETLLGGWPSDELNDGFEDAVAEWRGQNLDAKGRA